MTKLTFLINRHEHSFPLKLPQHLVSIARLATQEMACRGPRVVADKLELGQRHSPQMTFTSPSSSSCSPLRRFATAQQRGGELLIANTSLKARCSLAAQQTDTISKTKQRGVNSAAVAASKREECKDITADE